MSTFIDSVAKCLGALTPCCRAFEMAQQRDNVHSVVVTDKQAVQACLRFAGINNGLQLERFKHLA